MQNEDILQTPYQLKNKILKNRIIMAPMTRASANDALVPTEAMAAYYARRTDAGLIITEGTLIRPDGQGHHHVPGIYSEEQITAWKRVTDRVHEKGGLIFLQLWHVGRVSHPIFLKDKLPLAPSETEMTGTIPRSSNLTFGKSRAASLDEINQLISDYRTAAMNAMSAGFDGVELHGANGYLIDQFLHHNTNHRGDRYGGTPQNMARFALEVVDACGQEIGFENVGLRLSPGAYLNQIQSDLRDGEVFKYLLLALSNRPIAYVHTGNFDDARTFPELDNMTMTRFIRTYYQGTLIACGSYSLMVAREGIERGAFDLIAMGRPFIANPDLVKKIQQNKPLKAYDLSMLNELH